MVLKRKRNVGNLVHYQYRNLIDELIKNKNFFSMDADVRAEQLIAQCEAVISMPFTSTALIGREMGKPSIYYFPNDLIMKDDRAAHGIPILIGRDELYYWLSEVLNRG
jgi:polysaccharide biosynthesis PFTS motif protein